ncbi:MAG TPA: RodZ domain-containing protein [Bryobacteraceae bacterium]|jgi:cytoskeletal protein RodZ|nr:RodZ domain-containing protein [Bryobacteraceae bacterium]
MPSIGEKLRVARTHLNLNLDEVAASTRISRKYLEAMERDDRSAFPAGFFYRSFVLQYARQIGCDAAEISADIEKILAAEAPLPLPGHTQLGVDVHLKPLPPAARKGITLMATGKVVSSFASFVLVVAACAGLYAWWGQARQDEAARAQVRQASQSATAVKTDRPSRQPDAQPSEPATPSPLDAQAQTPSDGDDGSEMPEDAHVSLNLAASEMTWLSVSADGRSVFSGVLQPKERKKLGAVERAKLVVGNAGGLTVEWNGKLIGTLGKRGQVRVVNFTPDAYTFLDTADRNHASHGPADGAGVDSTR